MTAMGVYDQIKTAFQDIIAPEMHALRVDGVDRELRTAIDIRERLAVLEARRSS